MRALCVVLVLLLAPAALAQRGLFTLSLQSGQVVGVAPTPGADRAVPLLGTLEHGFSERWSLAGSAHVEFAPGGPTLAISLAPHLTLFKSTWWTVEVLLAPEALWLPAAKRFDLGARVGASVRYLVMWGVGVVFEAGVRGRTEATGPFAPAMQGYLLGGLFIEA